MGRPAVMFCVLLAAMLAAVVPDGTRGQFGREPRGRVEFENGRDARGLPFELNSDKMYLRTTINGRGPYWLVLDTGSPGMIVDTRVARELGLTTGESWRAGGAGDRPFYLSVVEDSVDVALDGKPAAELRLEGIRRLFRRPAGTPMQIDIKRDGVHTNASLTLRAVI